MLTHLDAEGRPRMVDVSAKCVSRRVAEARGFIRVNRETLGLIESGEIAKGNVLITAELAGVQGAKQTAALIPLCHPLPLTGITVAARIQEDGVDVHATVTCTERTGVEMEALTAVSVALLTVYDMCKAVDKTMMITEISLVRKTKQPLDAETVPHAPGDGTRESRA